MSVLYFMRDYSENFHIKKPIHLTSSDILILKDTVGSRQMCAGPYYVVDSRQNCAEPFGSSMTYKSFCLFQCIWLPSRVTYPWCIANWSHWNHCIWSQDHKEHNRIPDFFLKKFVFFGLLGPYTLISVTPIGNTSEMRVICIGTSRKT